MGLFQWLPLASGGERREAAVGGGSVSGSRDATNSKRNAPAVSRRPPPPPAARKWEPLEQTLCVKSRDNAGFMTRPPSREWSEEYK